MNEFRVNCSSRRFQHAVLLLCALCFMVSCAGDGYVDRTYRARHAFEHGKYEKALRWYSKQKPPKRDRLLYLLDQGVILHTAGQYAESIKIFDEAIELSDSLHGAQIAAKVASLVSNDNYIPYQGEKFERFLMHVFQVLNYLGLGEYNEALIEVRRIHNRFGSFFKDNAKPYLRNGFATYLSGLVWEANGKLNDAYIDYKKTYRINGSFPALEQDLLEGARYLGFLNEYQRWRKKFGQKHQAKPNKHGEVILIIEEGTVPDKHSTEEHHGLQVIPIPYYPRPLHEPEPVTITVQGFGEEEAIPLYPVSEAAAATLEDEEAAIVARALGRLAVKEGAAVAVGKEVDEELGIFLGIVVLATNRADLRSWLTLPRSMQVTKFSLPEGRYDLILKWPGGIRKIKDVEVQALKKRFLTLRVF